MFGAATWIGLCTCSFLVRLIVCRFDSTGRVQVIALIQ